MSKALVKRTDGNEVISGGRRPFRGLQKQRQPGITPIEIWEDIFGKKDYHADIDKILEQPDIKKDMAGVLARGFYKKDDLRIALLRAIYKVKRFNLPDECLDVLAAAVASTMGIGALGKLLQLQLGTLLMAPGVIREILGMKNVKDETVHRGSDFRDKETQSQQQEVQR